MKVAINSQGRTDGGIWQGGWKYFHPPWYMGIYTVSQKTGHL